MLSTSCGASWVRRASNRDQNSSGNEGFAARWAGRFARMAASITSTLPLVSSTRRAAATRAGSGAFCACPIAAGSASSARVNGIARRRGMFIADLLGVGRTVAGEAQLEVPPHVRPFRCEDAVHHDIARTAVTPRAEVTDHAVLLRPQRFDGALRAKVERVGAQTHDLAV